jgi:hypothetical protein
MGHREKTTAIKASFAEDDEKPLTMASDKDKGKAKNDSADLFMDQEDDTLHALMNHKRAKQPSAQRAPAPPPGPPPASRRPLAMPTPQQEQGEDDWSDEDADDEGGDMDDDGFEDPYDGGVNDDMVDQAERMRSEKMEVLNRLHRLTQKGVEVPSHLSMRTSLDELKAELSK